MELWTLEGNLKQLDGEAWVPGPLYIEPIDSAGKPVTITNTTGTIFNPDREPFPVADDGTFSINLPSPGVGTWPAAFGFRVRTKIGPAARGHVVPSQPSGTTRQLREFIDNTDTSPVPPNPSDQSRISVLEDEVDSLVIDVDSRVPATRKVNGLELDEDITLTPSDIEAQPVSDDLTAIALLNTNPYGRALLELVDQAGLMGLLAAGTTSAVGLVRLATVLQATTGTATDVAVTPAGLKAGIDAVIGAAPGALDTLKELADALGDDPHFATTVTNALAGKVDKTTTVNWHPLSGDVTLVPGDVGAATAAQGAKADAAAPQASTYTKADVDGFLVGKEPLGAGVLAGVVTVGKTQGQCSFYTGDYASDDLAVAAAIAAATSIGTGILIKEGAYDFVNGVAVATSCTVQGVGRSTSIRWKNGNTFANTNPGANYLFTLASYARLFNLELRGRATWNCTVNGVATYSPGATISGTNTLGGGVLITGTAPQIGNLTLWSFAEDGINLAGANSSSQAGSIRAANIHIWGCGGKGINLPNTFAPDGAWSNVMVGWCATGVVNYSASHGWTNLHVWGSQNRNFEQYGYSFRMSSPYIENGGSDGLLCSGVGSGAIVGGDFWENGVSGQATAIKLVNSRNIAINGNTIHENRGSGIEESGTSGNNNIRGNTFSDSWAVSSTTGNLKTYTGSISSGSTAFTGSAANFTAADLYRTIVITGAGAAGADLVATITGYTDSTHVTLGTAAGTAVSGATYVKHATLRQTKAATVGASAWAGNAIGANTFLYANVADTTASVEWTPADHGLLAWSFDPSSISGSSTPLVAGTAITVKLKWQRGKTLTGLLISIQTAGSGLTSGQCFAQAFDSAGNLLGTTTDRSAVWNATGVKQNNLVTPVVVDDDYIYATFYANGTTPPAIARGSSNGANTANQSSAYRYGTAGTGLTTTPPSSLGTVTAGTVAWWVGAY